jgi:hypothetical protein
MKGHEASKSESACQSKGVDFRSSIDGVEHGRVE